LIRRRRVNSTVGPHTRDSKDGITNSMINDLPDDIRRAVLQELANDSTVESIWLIGSRANSRAKAASDWDFLIFFNAEPAYVAATRSEHRPVARGTFWYRAYRRWREIAFSRFSMETD